MNNMSEGTGLNQAFDRVTSKGCDIFTIVERGSRVYGMNNPESDHDLLCIYSMDTKDILRKNNFGIKIPNVIIKSEDTKYDIDFVEIGNHITQLIKGNVNAVLTTCSPMVYAYVENTLDPIVFHSDHARLREITLDNLSKAIYPSLKGWIKGYESRMYKENNPDKRAKYGDRFSMFCKFGVDLFENHKVNYDLKLSERDIRDKEKLYFKLERAYENTTLKDKPEEREFMEFLLGYRLKKI